jgi:hypothetical protein
MLGTLNSNWTTQIVHLGELNIANVIGAVVVFALATGPVITLDSADRPRLHRDHRPFDVVRRFARIWGNKEESGKS